MGPVVAFRAAASAILERYQWMRQAGITFGGDRDLYEIFGYDRLVTNKMYRDRYARGGIAGRIVDALPNATWRGEMELVEDEDPKTDTAFEQAWKALDTRLQIRAKLLRADKLAGQSTYAALLIGAPGDLSEELPRGNPDQLLYLSPFSGGGGPGGDANARAASIDADCTIMEFEVDPTSPRFGLPKSYQLKRTDVSSPAMQRPVHWTRILHVAENLLGDDVYGQPSLERVWNLLDDLDKVTGGGAEAFFQRANQGMNLNLDKDVTLSPTAEAALVDEVKEYRNNISRVLKTRGMNVEMLGSDVANFSNPSDAVLTQIAGAKAIPKRILTGAEMGELASSQDRDNWKDQINGRQTNYAGPYIVRPLVDRLVKYGYLPTPKKGALAYVVRWPTIQTLTEAEKAEGAKSWSETVDAAGQPVFINEEIRDKWYGMEPLTPEQLTANKKPEPVAPVVAQPGFPRAAEDANEEMVRVLAAAIEANVTDVIDLIVGTSHQDEDLD